VQVAQRLADGDAADAEGGHQLVFRGQPFMHGIVAFENLASEGVADLHIQRQWRLTRGERF